ncbi:RUS1 family protein [Phanerochaete sordida]|uniref:RUS1 family protein n=1 Tax=Phanerochaete sordida TaxID=48140 RepID=A0A9P3GHI4_9APHY|nr:RUS1 family protein [Phanerochaete sordida]
MIQERDESGSLRAVYDIQEADDHKVPREVVSVRAVGGGSSISHGFTRVLQGMFLPAGYPASVSSDYTRYQVLNALQGFFSSLGGLVASRAVLEGHGVGSANASATNALLLTILQDIFSRVTAILSGYYLGTALFPEAKTYRFLADIWNDIPLVLDTLSPLLSHVSLDFVRLPYPPFLLPTLVNRPGPWRGIALCFSGIFRSMCAVAAAGSKAALTLHFAQPDHGAASGDISDLSAKDGSKETVLALVGMLCGSVIMPLIQTQAETYSLLAVIIVAHIWINYYAVHSVVFKSYNRQRTSILWDAFRDSEGEHRCLTPREVARHERIFHNAPALFRTDLRTGARRVIGTCDMGSPLASLLPCAPGTQSLLAPRHACPRWTGAAEQPLVGALLRLFADAQYVLWLDAHADPAAGTHVRVVLKAGHTSRDQMHAWAHALELARAREARRAADVAGILAEVRAAKEAVDAQFDAFLAHTHKAGWDMDAAAGGFVTGMPAVIEVSADGEDKKER